MKKIVPFKKDILFKTNISEITSISLDHKLEIEEKQVKGNFYINGEYKNDDISDAIKFSYDLPFVVDMDDKYILNDSIADIDDFYYEVIDSNILRVGIDVLIDKIEEIEVVEEIEEKRCVEEEIETPKKEEKKDVKIGDEIYKSYTVYIFRENDTLNKIIKKYETTKEEIEKYNDISNIKIGDKIIIPCS